jgi:hypothetical protein
MHIIDPMRYGYATVSTDDQSIDGQVRQLKAAGCKTVDREVPSGAKTDRAQLRRLLGQLEPGDVIASACWCRVSLGLRPIFTPRAFARALSSPVRVRIRSRSSADGDAARPAGPITPRPVEHPCGDHGPEGGIPVPWRHMDGQPPHHTGA